MPLPALAIPAIIGGVAGLAGGALNFFSQKKTNQSNVQMQRETNQTQMQLQENTNAQNEMLTREAWARDDNATQRRVADLRAAGLSPTLAAGSPAGVSAPIKAGTADINSPHVQSARSGDALMSAVDFALQSMQMQADYTMTKAQSNLIREQTEAQRIQNLQAQARFESEQGLRGAQTTHYATQTSNISNRTSMDQYDFELAKQWNVPTSQHGVIGQVMPLLNFLQGSLKEGTITNQIAEQIKDIIPDITENITQGRGLIGAIDNVVTKTPMKFTPLGAILQQFTQEGGIKRGFRNPFQRRD